MVQNITSILISMKQNAVNFYKTKTPNKIELEQSTQLCTSISLITAHFTITHINIFTGLSVVCTFN